MKQMNMTIRPAVVADAPMIAEGIFRAFLLDENHPHRDEWMRVLCDVCAQADTQYSYTNTAIAHDADGCVLGIMICIDGADYARQRRNMFAQLFDIFNDVFGVDWEKMPDEAVPGQLYIDSLAVFPKYQGHGVGTALLQHAIDKAHSKQLVATLAVEPSNPAKRLYTRLGFAYDHDVVIFNERYEYWAIQK